MSHWFHRNPIKATSRLKFDLGLVSSTTPCRQLTNELAGKRMKLIEMLSNPNLAIEPLVEALTQYLSLFLGFCFEPPVSESAAATAASTASDLTASAENIALKVSSSSKESKLKSAVKFKWSNSLTVRGDKAIEQYDAFFELVSILENVALWYTKHAAKISAKEEVTMEEAQEIHRCLRSAAGLFQLVRDDFVARVDNKNVGSTSDLDMAVLEGYFNQCSAEAQEVTMARAVELKHSFSIIAGLAFETSKMFETADLSLANCNQTVVTKWRKYLQFKTFCYSAYAYSYHGEQLLQEEKGGEAIACLNEAAKAYEKCEIASKEYAKADGPGMTARPQEHLFFRRLQPHLARTAEKCRRENMMLYHQKVPDVIPLLNLKAAFGLANPIAFELPPMNPLWTKNYVNFDATRLAGNDAATTNKKEAGSGSGSGGASASNQGANASAANSDKNAPVEPVKEEPIYQSDRDPKNNSGCVIS